MCTKFKATEQFFPSMAELIMLYKMVLTFESGKEILTILSRGTVYYSVHWSLTLCSYKGAALYSETVLQNGKAIFFIRRSSEYRIITRGRSTWRC